MNSDTQPSESPQIDVPVVVIFLGFVMCGCGAGKLDGRAQQLSAFWHSGPLGWEEMVATGNLFVVIAFAVFLVGGTAADLIGGRWRDRRVGWWLAAGFGVGLWSFFVRFVVAEPNILTDGGSGYGRVMRYIDGYGGMATLVKLLPATWDGFMWRAMFVPRALGAMAPVFLVWVAGGLGLNRFSSVLAGLMLASLPIHAALTSSDLLVGPMASVQLAGLALALAARRFDRVDLLATGFVVVCWAMWFRPEGGLGLLPLVAVLVLYFRAWTARPSVLAVGAVAALLVALRAIALATATTSGSTGGGGSLSNVDWSVFVSGAVTPWWLWLPLLVAPFVLSGRQILVVLAGLITGVLPVYLRGMFPDPPGTHLDTLRYGQPAFAWLILASAASCDAVAGWVSRRAGDESRWKWLVRPCLVLLVMFSIVTHSDYLGRRYGHSASETAVLEVLALVPEGCGVIVADDRADGVNWEIHQRYQSIAAEAYAMGKLRLVEIVPILDYLGAEDTASAGCWTYLKGPYCSHAFRGRKAVACEKIEQGFVLEEIASVPVEFFHHRLISAPQVLRAPWYTQEMPITLYRVLGPIR